MQACIATGPVSFRGIIKKSCELAFEMSLRKLKIMHKDKKMLVCNGFPVDFLDDCVRNFLHILYILITRGSGVETRGNSIATLLFGVGTRSHTFLY